MPDLNQLLGASLPEAIGGLAAAVVVALLGLLYRRLSRRGKKQPPPRGAQVRLGDVSGQVAVGEHITQIQQVLPSPARPPLQRPRRARHFVGREAALARLLDDLRPGQVVTLCGPGGVGKTALAAEVVWRLAPGDEPPHDFPDGIICYSFYKQPQADLALEAIARAYGEEPRPTPVAAAQRALAGRRALLVLDGAENADDLEAVVGVAASCGVLITSRQRRDVVDIRRDLRILPLDEAVQLLQAWGGKCAADEAAARRICELVGGLPLAVRLAGRYLAERDEAAADYLAWLEATPLAALEHGRRRQDSVPLLLERSLDQVSPQAQGALGVVGMQALAPFPRQPVAAALGVTDRDAGRVLGELVDYGLLLHEAAHYRVSHALVHTYARERLLPATAIAGRLAAYYTRLVNKQSTLGPQGYPALDAQRPHLMAVLAGCVEAQAWGEARDLAQAVDSYLDLQGHWTERQAALEASLAAVRALGALEQGQGEGPHLIKLGLVYADLGQAERAISFYEQALAVSREIGHRRDEGNALGHLGEACFSLGQVTRAVDYYQQALDIARQVGDRRAEGDWLGGLGDAYYFLGWAGRAQNYYQEALTIARQNRDQRQRGVWLRSLGQVERAIELFQQALAMHRETGDRRGEGNRLGNLGSAYADLGQLEQAVDYHQQALDIAREIGDRRGEGIKLGNLGVSYRRLGETRRAIEYAQQGLRIADEIGDVASAGFRRWELGTAYAELGQAAQARYYLEEALDRFREMKSAHVERIRSQLAELEGEL